MDGNTHFTFQQFFENKIQDDTKPYEKKVSEDLWIAFHMVKKKLKKELDITHSMYPHYSTHDYIHSGNIVLAIENILSREQWEKLFIADAWMFLCCAYIHDIGMTVYWDELMNDWNTKEFKEYLEYCTVSNDKSIRTASEHLLSKVIDFEKIVPPIIKREVMLLAADFYRSKHTKRIKDRSEKILSVFFSEINEVFDLPINSLEKIIEISAMHGESFEILLNSLDKADMILGMTYHPRFVASLLRLGDLCDFDNNRFSLEWIKSCGGLTEDNLVHYFKHLFVKNKYISSKEINVVVDIDCNKVDMELVNNGLAEEGILFENDGKKHDLYGRIAKESNNWFGWLENEINHIKENWNCIMPDDFPMISPEYNYKIKMDGIELLFSTSNLRFTFSQEKSYTLIENYNLYNEQLIFVREVIQNSMDALKLKFWHELKSGNFDHLIIQERLCELCDKEHNIDYSQLRPFDFIDNSIYKKYSINIFVEPDFMLYFQFLMRGLELMILRIGMPMACVGLLDNDKGVFKTYINKFFQSMLAVLIQICLCKLGVGMMLNIGINMNVFWGLACMVLAIKTPAFLRDFLVPTGGGASGVINNVYHSVRLVGMVKGMAK